MWKRAIGNRKLVRVRRLRHEEKDSQSLDGRPGEERKLYHGSLNSYLTRRSNEGIIPKLNKDLQIHNYCVAPDTVAVN